MSLKLCGAGMGVVSGPRLGSGPDSDCTNGADARAGPPPLSAGLEAVAAGAAGAAGVAAAGAASLQRRRPWMPLVNN